MTKKENITPVLKTHKSELSKYGVSNIGLLGSHLSNEQSAQSGIDLLVDFAPDKENSDNYLAVYDILAFIGMGKSK